MLRYARNVGAVGCTLFLVFLIWKFLHGGEDLKRSAQDDDSRVTVSVYYESLCPDSVKFVQEQLWPTYDKLKGFVDFDLVPYGKASFHPNGKSWSFTCQHGPAECKGNKLQACAVKIYPEQDLVVPFVNCVMISEYPPNAGEKCSKQVKLDWNRLQECFDGNEGNDYLHEMGVRTANLSPRLVFVPWINLNGQHTDDIQRQALNDLLGLVCNSFQNSSKPPACS